MAVFVSHAFVLYLNPLPVPHIDGPFLFGPNRFFHDYLEGRNIAFEDQELQVDFSSMNEMGITRGASFKNEREIRSGASPVLSMNS